MWICRRCTLGEKQATTPGYCYRAAQFFTQDTLCLWPLFRSFARLRHALRSRQDDRRRISQSSPRFRCPQSIFFFFAWRHLVRRPKHPSDTTCLGVMVAGGGILFLSKGKGLVMTVWAVAACCNPAFGRDTPCPFCRSNLLCLKQLLFLLPSVPVCCFYTK